MLLVDTRRLTGPNLLASVPVVLVELALEAGEALEPCVATYLGELGRMLRALGLPPEVVPLVLAHRGGGLVGYRAPIDTMLAFAEMSEWAALSAVEVLAGREASPISPKDAEIEAMIAQLASPSMLALAGASSARGLPFLWDDDAVSVGLGSRSRTFARAEIPAPETVDWDVIGRIPVVMVTGTNGKTTSTRILARLATEAGHRVGSTSSDGITVGGAVLEQGDWTGPAAARTVLRHREVDLAVLETARGGILRRGLALESCEVALLTNVSEDHVGTGGVDDAAAMTRVKSVIARAVRPGGTVVLNAHDRNLVELAQHLTEKVTFFADLERDDAFAAEVVERHRSLAGACVVARSGRVICIEGAEEEVLDTPIAAMPITVGGRARYNVENVLGAVAAARALGLPTAALEGGLRHFAIADNPGRGQLVELGGVRLMLDFGHNPEGVRAVLRLVTSLRSDRQGKLSVIAGCAGDRTDRDIEAMAGAILEARPDRVILRDLADYLRGRAPGEVPDRFRTALVEQGLPVGQVKITSSEVAALEEALGDAAGGDFVVLLAHVEHAAVDAFLAGYPRDRPQPSGADRVEP